MRRVLHQQEGYDLFLETNYRLLYDFYMTIWWGRRVHTQDGLFQSESFGESVAEVLDMVEEGLTRECPRCGALLGKPCRPSCFRIEEEEK